MGTFSVSMPEELTRKLDAVADKEHRSRSAQVIFILEEWFATEKELREIQTVMKEKGP